MKCLKYTIDSVEIMISISKDQGTYEEVKEKLREELRDPDFGDGLGYGLVENYNLDEIDHDDEDDVCYFFRVVYTY